MRPWPCLVELRRRRRHGSSRPGEVDRQHPDDPGRVGLVDLLMPELAHCDDDHVDVLSGGFEALDDHLVGAGGAVGVGGVELHRLDVGDRLAQCPGGLLEPAGVAPGEDDGPAAVDGQQRDDGARDVRGPTEDHHRLWMPEGVVHRGIPSRRERSEARTPSGSTRRQAATRSRSPGYMAGSSSGRRRASLAR